MTALSEEWRPVVGWENLYEVSDHGRVRSLDRLVVRKTGAQVMVEGRILIPQRTVTDARLCVTLSANGLKRGVPIHRAVLEAFVGPRPDGMEGCHFNDDKNDNRLVNLRWDTHSANMKDRVRNGGNPHSNKTHCSAGHEYDLANTYRRKCGRRACRACQRELMRRRRQMKRVVSA